MGDVAKIPSLAMLLAIAAGTACSGGEASPAEARAARRVQDAALAEVAQALLLVESGGGYLGARFVASLDEGAGGKPLVRIYAGSPAPA